MSACLKFDEILDDGKPRLANLQSVGASFPNAALPGACEAFSQEVARLDGYIRSTYALAVSFAKREEDLDEIAQIWEKMGSFCKTSLEVLSKLKNKYPDCGTPSLFDLALDYKLACDTRYRNVQEEIKCQNQEVPTGLFPAQM